MDYVTLITTGNDELKIPAGVEVIVSSEACGLKEGYGRVVNGYFEGLDYFDKPSDGDTVVGAHQNDEGALPIADAYWLLHYIFDRDYADIAINSILGGYSTFEEEFSYYENNVRVQEWIREGISSQS